MTNEEIMILGKLSGQMEAVLDKQGEQTANIGKIFERLDKMPCENHTTAIKIFNKWKDTCEGNDQAGHVENIKGGWSLKVALVTSILGTGVITTIIIKLFELVGK